MNVSSSPANRKIEFSKFISVIPNELLRFCVVDFAPTIAPADSNTVVQLQKKYISSHKFNQS